MQMCSLITTLANYSTVTISRFLKVVFYAVLPSEVSDQDIIIFVGFLDCQFSLNSVYHKDLGSPACIVCVVTSSRKLNRS